MAIQKQAFYEGAALHMITRVRGVNIRYDAPFFLLDNRLHVFLKYSTKGRSPWGFTFTPSEQVDLASRGEESAIVIGLICGADGVATLAYGDYSQIALQQKTSVHVACYRQHNEHYEISGPNGVLGTKVPPSMWQRILQGEEIFYATS